MISATITADAMSIVPTGSVIIRMIAFARNNALYA
jgi:hypothetical protein